MRSISREGGRKWTWMLNHEEMDGAIKACYFMLWDFRLFLTCLYLISLFMCMDEMDARVTRKQIVAWKLPSILGVLDISDLAFPVSFSFINPHVISKFEFLLQPWGRGFQLFDKKLRIKSATRRSSRTGLRGFNVVRKKKRPLTLVVTSANSYMHVLPLKWDEFQNLDD